MYIWNHYEITGLKIIEEFNNDKLF